ncbi:MAG TPA: aminomethyltransferase beta-barrel domain-containing protein, partial [Spirochaetota bacterium]
LLGVRDTGGEIVRADGEVVGSHKGLWNFTPGQRRGIGVSSHAPLYVVRLDPSNNRVVVGSKDELRARSFIIGDANWISIESVQSGIDLSVRLRSSAKEVSCVISPADDGKIRVDLSAATDFVAPGQSAVFYSGDDVVGGGVIERILR